MRPTALAHFLATRPRLGELSAHSAKQTFALAASKAILGTWKLQPDWWSQAAVNYVDADANLAALSARDCIFAVPQLRDESIHRKG